METLKIDPKSINLDQLIDRGVHLHGHLGPFLVAGIRMGLLALELLDSPGYFGIHVVSDTGDETPLSCLTDGLQIGSGCTAGKGNLVVTSECKPQAHFETNGGKRLTIVLRPEALADFKRGEIKEESRRTATRPREDLFTWKIDR